MAQSFGLAIKKQNCTSTTYTKYRNIY